MRCAECQCAPQVCIKQSYLQCKNCTKADCCCISFHQQQTDRPLSSPFRYLDQVKGLYAAALGIEILCIAALLVAIVAAAPIMVFAQQAQNATQGFGGPPSGPLTAIRHIFDDPTLRVWHFCKPNDKIMMICQLYDSNSPNSTLIGVEYMMTADAYKNLPDREKPNWHYHKEEFAPNRADPKLPQLSEQQQNATLKKLEESYGKVIITWNPNDNAPVFPPQVEQVQHPFMINTTVTPETETEAGTFNQTLKY